MDTSDISRSGSAARRHGRNISYGNRTPLPRRSTKGPLDIVEDPLAIASSPTSSILPTSPPKTDAATPISIRPSSPATTSRPTNLAPKPPLPSRPRSRSPRPPSLKDFLFLRRPENFHSLPQQDPILATSSQLPPDTPLPTLLAQFDYRSAAISATTTLTSTSRLPPPDIFKLWYVRLACLTLTTHTPLAAQESLVLGDIHSAYYIDDETGECILPWELRVLAIRLQNLGAKAQVQGYYDLAAYARRRLKSTPRKYQNAANNNNAAEARQIWKERLKDLSYRITNSLIETGDLPAARRHLESLHHHAAATSSNPTTKTHETETTEQTTLTTWLALLALKMGNLPAANRWIHPHIPTPATLLPNEAPAPNNILTPLLSIAQSRPEDAVTASRALLSSPSLPLQPPATATIAQHNLSTALLYTGHLASARAILEDEVERGGGGCRRATAFNLATVYELSGERAGERKRELVRRVGVRSSRDGGGGGIMGLGKGDFKL
ncbi:MAG: hypothetical protein Q9202_005299 [Teloschistes flavicans]